MSATAALMIGVTLAGGLWPFADKTPVADRQTIGSLQMKDLDLRTGPEERFIDTYRRTGIDPFKEKVYGNLKERRSAAE